MDFSQRRVKRDPHFTDGLDNTKAAAELFSSRNLTRDALANLSLEASLRVDPRPTFVVCLDLTTTNPTITCRDHLRISYKNPALVEQTALLDDISGKSEENNKIVSSYAAFRRWVVDSNHKNSSPFMFKEYLWTAYTLHDRRYSYRIISGTTLNSLWSDQCSEKSETPIADEYDDDYEREPSGLERISSLDPATLFKQDEAKGRSTNHDWTQPEPPSDLSDHIKYARGVDWKTTALGPMEGWGIELRAAANLVMADLHAAVLFWWTEGTMIYNEQYSRLIEGLHPCIGQSCFTALKDYTDHVSDVPSFCESPPGTTKDRTKRKDLSEHVQNSSQRRLELGVSGTSCFLCNLSIVYSKIAQLSSKDLGLTSSCSLSDKLFYPPCPI